MGMETKKGFCLISNVLLEDSVKVFVISCRNYVFSDESDVNFWLFDGQRYQYYKSKDCNNLTIHGGDSIESEGYNKKKGELE